MDIGVDLGYPTLTSPDSRYIGSRHDSENRGVGSGRYNRMQLSVASHRLPAESLTDFLTRSFLTTLPIGRAAQVLAPLPVG